MRRLAFTCLALCAVFFLDGCARHYVREEADGVHLYLRDDRAAEVQFASSLDGFALHRAQKVEAGTWRMTLPNAGEFRYFYRVDGKLFLPGCERREMDDYGSYNCLYSPEPESPGVK